LKRIIAKESGWPIKQHLKIILFFSCNFWIYGENIISFFIKQNKLRGLSPRANYTTEQPPFVSEVSANFCG
jgi:hypothetical protein